MKVDFVICGTQKGGTTALDAYLREHPQICMANGKEVHFFDNEQVFAEKRVDYAHYHAAFSPTPSHQFIGEATPIYMYWHDATRRIWQYNPEMKVIALLRNPIERAYSHWNMERSRNVEPLSFWEALQAEPQRGREALPFQHRVYSYIDRGFYLEQIRRLWRYFPKQNILIMKSEFLKEQPTAALQEVCQFLGVAPLKSVVPREVHVRPYSSKMSDREVDCLRSLFEHEIRGIERALGWDCPHWLSG